MQSIRHRLRIELIYFLYDMDKKDVEEFLELYVRKYRDNFLKLEGKIEDAKTQAALLRAYVMKLQGRL